MPRRAPDDDPYRDLPDSSADSDPYRELPDTSDFTLNPSREGTYSMADSTGKKFKIPYSAIGRASKSGYTMMPEDRERYVRDAAYDPKREEGVDLPEGVVVVGRNSAGVPILAPAGPGKPQGSAARRFLKSAVDALVGPIKGVYHGLADAPQNPEEAMLAARPFTGPFDVRVERFVTGPLKAEARKTAEEFARSGAGPEATEHRILTAVHGLGTAVPLLGPAAAEFVEGTREKYAQGDIAGALGGGAGNVAAYLAPEGLGAVAKSRWLTRSIPRSMVTRMIRPAAADLKFGKNPARAILDEGITGNTLEDIGNKVSERLGEVGRELDREAQKPANAAKVVDVSASLQPLDAAMAEALKAGDRQLFRKLQSVRSELTQNWRAFRTPGGRVVMRPTGPRSMTMSPFEALTFKRMVGDRIAWTADPLQGKVNQALAGVYGEVKEATNNAVPGLKELNEKFSDLVGAAQAVRRRLPVESRNAAWSLSDIVIGTHNVPLAAARHIARTPAVRSRAAVGLYNLPRVLPRHPALMAAPATGVAASAEQLREEAERRRLAAQP